MNLPRRVAAGLLGLYLASAAFAFVAALANLGDGPLSAVFLVIAAFPWTLPMGWLLDRLAEPPPWRSYALTLAGVLVNALLLYGLLRLTRRRPS
jgi:hypothetical protein